MKKRESMSVDDFLALPQALTLPVVLERVPESDELVSVVPLSEAGCNCAAALRVPKKAIRSVVPTGTRHYCCGKGHEIVEVEFAPGTMVPVEDVISRWPVPVPQNPNPFPVDPRVGIAVKYCGSECINGERFVCYCDENGNKVCYSTGTSCGSGGSLFPRPPWIETRPGTRWFGW